MWQQRPWQAKQWRRWSRVSGMLAAVLLAGGALAEPKTVGTITATIAGEEMVFHALHSEVDEHHAAVWVAREEPVRTVVLGGYESLDVEFAGSSVSGEGAMLAISFNYQAGQTSASFSIPGGDDELVNIILMTRVGDYTSARMMDQGQLEVSRIEGSADDTARFQGTFSGSMENLDGARVEVTNGSFEVLARQLEP